MSGNVFLSWEEKKIIELYRKCDDRGKRDILSSAKICYESQLEFEHASRKERFKVVRQNV